MLPGVVLQHEDSGLFVSVAGLQRRQLPHFRYCVSVSLVAIFTDAAVAHRHLQAKERIVPLDELLCHNVIGPDSTKAPTFMLPGFVLQRTTTHDYVVVEHLRNPEHLRYTATLIAAVIYPTSEMALAECREGERVMSLTALLGPNIALNSAVPPSKPPQQVTDCTCECPDGPDQHLENCEVYLNGVERWALQEIESAYRAVRKHLPPGQRVLFDLLLYKAIAFCQAKQSPSISSPQSVILRRLNNLVPPWAPLA